MIRVRLTVPELDTPLFDDKVTKENLNTFIKKFDEMIDKYHLDSSYSLFKDRIREEVIEDEDDYNTSIYVNPNRKTVFKTNKSSIDEITKKDKEFIQQCKDSHLFKKAPKEVIDYLNSLDKADEPDPNEPISFWITYHATFLTELYSPEFFKRNPQEVIDDIDDLSMKVTIPRSELKNPNPFGLIKKEFVKAMLNTLNIDPTSIGKEFSESFLAKTGIIYLDIVGIDLTRAIQEKYAGNDKDIDNFMIEVYNGSYKDEDIITYRDIETLIK